MTSSISYQPQSNKHSHTIAQPRRSTNDLVKKKLWNSLSYIITLSYSCFGSSGVSFLLFAPPLEDFSSDLVGLSGVTVFLPLSLRYQFCLRIFFFLNFSAPPINTTISRSRSVPSCGSTAKKKSLLLSIPLTLAGCPWWRSLSPPALFLLSQIDAYTRGGAYRPPANLDPIKAILFCALVVSFTHIILPNIFQNVVWDVSWTWSWRLLYGFTESMLGTSFVLVGCVTTQGLLLLS